MNKESFLEWQYHTLRKEIETSKDRQFKIGAGSLVIVPAVEILAIGERYGHRSRDSHAGVVAALTNNCTGSTRIVFCGTSRDKPVCSLHSRTYRIRHEG